MLVTRDLRCIFTTESECFLKEDVSVEGKRGFKLRKKVPGPRRL